MLTTDVVNIAANESLPALVDPRTEGVLMSARREWPDASDRRRLRNWLTLKMKEHAAWVLAITEKPERINEADDWMIQTFGNAMLAGHALAGLQNVKLTDQEVIAVAALAESEKEYLRKFVGGDEAMSTKQRSTLYGGAVAGAFYRGWVAMLPANSLIEWRLGIAEHCPGCISLAARSPYTKPSIGSNPLPTVPRNGDTQCLGNCLCFLVAKLPWFLQSQLAPNIGLEILAIAGRRVDPTSQEARAWSSQYQRQMELLAWYRRMAIVNATAEAKWMASADLLDVGIQQSATRQRLTIGSAMTDQEVRAPIDRAATAGLKWVRPSEFDSTLVGVTLAILIGDEVKRGKAIAVTQVSQSITLEDGSWYQQNEIGRAIAFREP